MICQISRCFTVVYCFALIVVTLTLSMVYVHQVQQMVMSGDIAGIAMILL